MHPPIGQVYGKAMRVDSTENSAAFESRVPQLEQHRRTRTRAPVGKGPSRLSQNTASSPLLTADLDPSSMLPVALGTCKLNHL